MLGGQQARYAAPLPAWTLFKAQLARFLGSRLPFFSSVAMPINIQETPTVHIDHADRYQSAWRAGRRTASVQPRAGLGTDRVDQESVRVPPTVKMVAIPPVVLERGVRWPGYHALGHNRQQ